ncbi:MAG: hypothetical protein SXQ77_02060 [Halobacteria archaeon]|nr:hypothetical protein [Halobacteria archaeon]
MIPYIMGANIGTLVDTLVVALVLGNPVGVKTVLLVAVMVSLVTLVILTLYGTYYDAVDTLDSFILSDNKVFAVFLALLVLIPSLLMGFGMVL